jgi:surface antigen
LLHHKNETRINMRTASHFQKVFAVTALVGGICALATPFNVWGDPPAHAPAHGWRKKHDPNNSGYTGKKWEKDYGIVNGTCDIKSVGQIVGGTITDAAGRSARPEAGAIATILGSVIGTVIDAKLGQSTTQVDRACMGHALELGSANKRVAWPGSDGRTQFLLTPTRGFQQNGQSCREFTVQATAAGQTRTTNGTACRTGDGRWQVIG